MRDVRIAEIAGGQHNRISLGQLLALGLTDSAIKHRVQQGRLVVVEQAVFAVAPVLDDPWGRWMGATLTAPRTCLSHTSAALAWGLRAPRPSEDGVVTVTRPGSGGRRRHGNVLAYRSETLEDNVTALNRVPITTPGRTLVDLAARASPEALAKMVREALRLRHATIADLEAALALNAGRRGVLRLAEILARLSDLPLHRARSDAESRALEVISAAGHAVPHLNRRIAGEEADLCWPRERLIVEIDGRGFHLDPAEDLRKQRAWEGDGWTVRRLGAQEVFDAPERLLALVPRSNVPQILP